MNPSRQRTPGGMSPAWLLEIVAMACFLLLAGSLLALPGRQWEWLLVGLGLILLAKSLACRILQLKAWPASVFLGGLFVTAGGLALALPDLPFIAVVLIVGGVAFLALPLAGARARGASRAWARRAKSWPCCHRGHSG